MLAPSVVCNTGVARLRVALRALATPRLGFYRYGLKDLAPTPAAAILACLGVEKQRIR